MVLSNKRIKRHLSDSTDAPAGLHLCCSQIPEDKVTSDEAQIIGGIAYQKFEFKILKMI